MPAPLTLTLTVAAYLVFGVLLGPELFRRAIGNPPLDPDDPNDRPAFGLVTLVWPVFLVLIPIVAVLSLVGWVVGWLRR